MAKNGQQDGPTPVDDYKEREADPKFLKYLKAVVDLDASDLHLKAGSPARIRVTGRMRPTKSEKLTSKQIEDMVMPMLSEPQKQFLHVHGAVDLAYELQDSDRFRINIFRQRGRLSLAARRVPRLIPEFKDLHLPKMVQQIAEYRQGLVLVSGITGAGKSTTLAAMLEHINRHRSCHIITVEDPIEFLFEDKKSFINQREIGIDVATFDDALRYLMREDPDVVLIGEMRDKDTFTAALRGSGNWALGIRDSACLQHPSDNYPHSGAVSAG
jgi:twitching motility protein PilT